MRRIRSLLLLLLLLTATGCWDYRRLTSVDFALGMAVDPDGTKGMRVTLQLPRPGVMKSGAAAGRQAFYLVDGRGRSFADALSDLQRRLSRPITFGQLQVLLLSGGVIRNMGEQLLEQLWRFAEVNKSAYIFLVEERPAAELLELVPPQEKVSALYLASAMESLRQTRTFVKPTTLMEAMVQAREPGRDPVMPAVGLEGDRLVMDRLAVFRHADLAEVLTPEESMAVVIALGALNNGTLTLERPNGDTWAFRRLRSAGSRLEVAESPAGRRLQIDVRLRGEIEGVGSIGRHVDDALRREMEAAIADRVRRLMLATLARLQKLEVDPLGFLARRYAEVPGGDQWRQVYRSAPVSVSVTMELRRKGAGD